MSAADRTRYRDAMHAMQTGVAMELQRDASSASPKHLRVGVNGALVDSGALATLLVEKGVFTRDEYDAALADAAEREKHRYEVLLTERLGIPVTLG